MSGRRDACHPAAPMIRQVMLPGALREQERFLTFLVNLMSGHREACSILEDSCAVCAQKNRTETSSRSVYTMSIRIAQSRIVALHCGGFLCPTRNNLGNPVVEAVLALPG